MASGEKLIAWWVMVFEVPPPGNGVTTEISTAVGVEINPSGTAADNWVELIKVVARAELPHITFALFEKLVPVTIRVYAELPIPVIIGVIFVIVGAGR